MLENYIAPFDATVVERIEAEDGVILGKLNMDEFAMGSTTQYSAFHPTKNPWDFSRVPGGSSGGSAAAVSARFCPIALGSDTGDLYVSQRHFVELLDLSLPMEQSPVTV